MSLFHKKKKKVFGLVFKNFFFFLLAASWLLNFKPVYRPLLKVLFNIME